MSIIRKFHRLRRPFVAGLGLVAGLNTPLAGAQGNPQKLGEIKVIGATPVHGSGIPKKDFPANVQSATAEEIRESHAANLTQFMNFHLGSVHVSDAQNNPLQKDVYYRGFVATPLLGAPQGISVYQDGVRLNEPFGDTVNWALIPESAIGSINLIPGSNPVFGRNTLGGALSITTKTGFSHPGTRGEVYGGSFERYYGQLETGGNNGDWGWFITGQYFDEQGWRDFSPSEAKNLFANLTWLQSGRTTWDLSLNLAETDLIGNGATPIELSDLDQKAIFTRPDQTVNDLVFFNLRGSHQATANVLLTGNAYFRMSDTDTLNGDESDYESCSSNPALVCRKDDGVEEVAEDPDLGPIPATASTVGVDGVTPPGTSNRSQTGQDGYGAAFQVTFLQDRFARQNQFIIGAEVVRGEVDFQQSTELGRLDDTRRTVGSGFFVEDQMTALSSTIANYSVYFTDTLHVTEALAVTLSGRYNHTDVEIEDESGMEPELNGEHSFDRFNPAIGAAYTFAPAITLFGGYSESNRVPTPSELTCADPDAPCRLPNAFLSDPPLDDVVAKTVEVGLRGDLGNMSYSIAVFNTRNEDDILFIADGNTIGAGFFENVGDTKRQGIELGLQGRVFERVQWFLNYTYLKAEFGEDFLVASEGNPAAIDLDSDGEGDTIRVEGGDRIPLIPEHLLKAGVNIRVLPNASVGITALYNGEQFFRGDEGNQLDELDGYTVVNLNGEYRFNKHIAATLRVVNLFDEEYETFGLFGEEPNEVLTGFAGFEDTRFVGPGAPRGVWIGLRAQF